VEALDRRTFAIVVTPPGHGDPGEEEVVDGPAQALGRRPGLSEGQAQDLEVAPVGALGPERRPRRVQLLDHGGGEVARLGAELPEVLRMAQQVRGTVGEGPWETDEAGGDVAHVVGDVVVGERVAGDDLRQIDRWLRRRVALVVGVRLGDGQPCCTVTDGVVELGREGPLAAFDTIDDDVLPQRAVADIGLGEEVTGPVDEGSQIALPRSIDASDVVVEVEVGRPLPTRRDDPAHARFDVLAEAGGGCHGVGQAAPEALEIEGPVVDRDRPAAGREQRIALEGPHHRLGAAHVIAGIARHDQPTSLGVPCSAADRCTTPGPGPVTRTNPAPAEGIRRRCDDRAAAWSRSVGLGPAASRDSDGGTRPFLWALRRTAR
jgi:hypothetical protein